jgi:hypothetical protein
MVVSKCIFLIKITKKEKRKATFSSIKIFLKDENVSIKEHGDSITMSVDIRRSRYDADNTTCRCVAEGPEHGRHGGCL